MSEDRPPTTADPEPDPMPDQRDQAPVATAGRGTRPGAPPDSGAAAAVATEAGEDVERPDRRLPPRLAAAVTVLAALLSVFVLWRVFFPDSRGALPYRITFLCAVLPLVFVCFPARRATPVGDHATNGAPDQHPDGDHAAIGGVRDDEPSRPAVLDWVLAAASIAALVWPLTRFDDFIARAAAPTTGDLVAGAIVIVLVLEATRRTTGWVLPAVCVVFLLYAYYGGYLPASWTIGHRGYDPDRIVEQLFMTTEGIFGVPLDVAATYIVLFTVYGAALQLSGGAQFFLDLSMAAFRRSRSAPGRTVTLAGFLLGTVSGSGTATAVSLGSVSWPILRRAGYPPEQGAGVLAAAGIGAILSPPTLGAAAFIIAEYLRVGYLTVMLYAVVPTLLYYLGILLAIEIDARRLGARPVEVATPPFGRLLLRFGYHFVSLVAIVVLLALDVSVFRAVVLATLLVVVLSFLDPAHRMTPRRIYRALALGVTGVLGVTATTAAAGIIVGITTLTGLGLNLSGIIVDAAGAVASHEGLALFLTAVLAAVAVMVLGLAVPVTASFVIAAVIIAPALKALGVSDAEAYMFVFYYAVLSEVSPPTALAAVASAAITGADPVKTMAVTWRYSLPAFLVPFAFVLTSNGSALLGQGGLGRVLLATLVSCLAVAALAVATGGWLFGPAGPLERGLCAVAAVALLFLDPVPVLAGAGFLAVAVVVHLFRRRREVPA